MSRCANRLVGLLAISCLSLYAEQSMAGDPEVVQISPDTYMITRSSKAGAFTNTSKLKSRVITQANNFAYSKGKSLVPISERLRQPNPGFPSYEYQFRLIDPDAPEVKPTTLEAGPDQVIQSTGKNDVNVTITEDSESKADLYTELIKLDDLRKRGILTDEEFDAQKKKLLEQD